MSTLTDRKAMAFKRLTEERDDAIRERDIARAEMVRHLPILERLETAPMLWDMATRGTGIATLNGYRMAAGLNPANKA